MSDSVCAMVLSFITNDPALAIAAGGIDRVFIDLERMGKAERQFGRALFISDHKIGDVRRMKEAVPSAKIMVRIDPLHDHTKQQIDRVISYGASSIMLPYFHSMDKAKEFVDIIAGRAVAALLVETPESVAVLPALCRLAGVGEIHTGLNDLSIALKYAFLFDVIADGTIDRICGILRDGGVPFGFGGIGSLSRKDLPVDPECVLAEQVLQGATRGWLSRTFREVPAAKLPEEVCKIRNAIEFWRSADPGAQAEIRAQLRCQILSASANIDHSAQMR
ncbi:MAG: aldolase [Bryobacteraceae bacterium]|nr:aldolase [Bryobacteraceae bacterium]